MRSGRPGGLFHVWHRRCIRNGASVDLTFQGRLVRLHIHVDGRRLGGARRHRRFTIRVRGRGGVDVVNSSSGDRCLTSLARHSLGLCGLLSLHGDDFDGGLGIDRARVRCCGDAAPDTAHDHQKAQDDPKRDSPSGTGPGVVATIVSITVVVTRPATAQLCLPTFISRTIDSLSCGYGEVTEQKDCQESEILRESCDSVHIIMLLFKFFSACIERVFVLIIYANGFYVFM